MSDMPTGSYIERDSILHRMDAFIKLLCIFLLLAAVILSDTVPGYLLIIAVIAGAILLSRIGFLQAVSGVLRMWLFFLLIFLMNAVFFETEHAFFSWWIFHLSAEGMIQGANVVLRVALAIVLGNILTSTTAPLDLTKAIETLIVPLQYIGVPVQEVAMILGVAIQFIPTFLEETDMIRKAQTARGARFESRKLTEKAQAVLPLVIPIFLSAFRRADELSIAMEARGYHSSRKRKHYRRRRISATDILFLLISCLFCAAELLL